MGFNPEELMKKIDNKAESLADGLAEKAKNKIKNMEKEYNSWISLCNRNDEKIARLYELKNIIESYEIFIIKRKQKLGERTDISILSGKIRKQAEWFGNERDLYDDFLTAQEAAYENYETTLNNMIDEILDKICRLTNEKNEIFGYIGDITSKFNSICTEIEKNTNDWDWLTLMD